MRNAFFEHHRYTNEQFETLLNEATIVLDANVLLNFYRFNIKDREKLFEVLKSVKAQLWLTLPSC